MHLDDVGSNGEDEGNSGSQQGLVAEKLHGVVQDSSVKSQPGGGGK